MANRTILNLASLVLVLVILASCSAGRRISRSADRTLFSDSALTAAHIGVSLYDADASKTLFDYQGTKYFVPASNTKIFTCYAAMKHLGDSLEAFRYVDMDTAVLIIPTGDPTFLHYDYQQQPAVQFLQSVGKPVYISMQPWEDDQLGSGWSWNDYSEYYMTERSAFPVYGNVIRWIQEKTGESPADETEFDQSVSIYSIPDIDWDVRFDPSGNSRSFRVKRDKDQNRFVVTQGRENRREVEVPYVTDGIASGLALLQDTVGAIQLHAGKLDSGLIARPVYSRPVDSMLRPLMYRSDNFFAEQTLLMVSSKLLGRMNDAAVIDSLLRSDLAGLPQQPRWADGSGLSRYNLFTPQSFIHILNMIRNEFGMERVKNIFATGGTGTLSNFYRQDSGYIYAKTGTLGGVVALSGYMTTKKNKLVLFSVLVNNHRGNAVDIRRKVEMFLQQVRNSY